MARTDKDAPDWVRARTSATRTPWHDWTCEDNPTHPGEAPCTLESALDPRRGCCWVDHDRHRYPWTGAPTRAERRTGYFRPERTAVRSQTRLVLREAATLLRDAGPDDALTALEDLAGEITIRQTRGSLWGGGWWD